jgi:hypothetical protein
MNKLLLAVITLAAGLSALAQGTVNINNNFTAVGASAKAFVYLDGGVLPVPKGLGRVEVLDATGAVISPIKDGTGNPFGADGLFFLGVTEVPGTSAGGNGSIAIRAWDSSTGSTYATALSKAIQVVTITGFGGGLTPTPTLGTAGNFAGLTLSPGAVPEPSTVALAALGVAGLFFVARRK